MSKVYNFLDDVLNSEPEVQFLDWIPEAEDHRSDLTKPDFFLKGWGWIDIGRRSLKREWTDTFPYPTIHVEERKMKYHPCYLIYVNNKNNKCVIVNTRDISSSEVLPCKYEGVGQFYIVPKEKATELDWTKDDIRKFLFEIEPKIFVEENLFFKRDTCLGAGIDVEQFKEEKD
jgi:hypothetical protein